MAVSTTLGGAIILPGIVARGAARAAYQPLDSDLALRENVEIWIDSGSVVEPTNTA